MDNEPFRPEDFTRYRIEAEPMTLFEIAEDLRHVAELLLADSDAGGELAVEKAAAIDAWFADLEAQEAQKLDGYVNLIRRIEMEQNAAEQESKYYGAIATQRKNAIGQLKTRILDYLDFTQRASVKTATGRTLRKQANGGSLPLEIDDVEATEVDEKFQKLELDRTAIKDALAGGEELPFARFGPRGYHLRIG